MHGSYVKWSDGGKILFCVRRCLGFWPRPALPHNSLMNVAKRMSGAESSISWQFLSYPINSWNFVQTEGSLSCSQHPVTCPCPEPDQSSASAHVLFRNHFNITISHLCLGLPVASFPQFSRQNPLMYLFYPSRASCPSRFLHPYLVTGIMPGEMYRTYSSSFCCLHNSSIKYPLSGPNNSLSTTLSITLKLYPSSDVTYPFWEPHIITSKNRILGALIYVVG